MGARLKACNFSAKSINGRETLCEHFQKEPYQRRLSFAMSTAFSAGQAKKHFDVHGMYVEGCPCPAPCACELTGPNSGICSLTGCYIHPPLQRGGRSRPNGPLESAPDSIICLQDHWTINPVEGCGLSDWRMTWFACPPYNVRERPMKNPLLTFSLGLFVLASLPACGQNQASATTAGNGQLTAQNDKSTPPAQKDQPAKTNQKGTMQDVAVLDTNLGTIVIAFYPDKAPGHVKNFETLAKKGFYDGTKFHRVIPGFMIQGGDPNTKTDNRSSYGQGGPGYTINQEFNDISHKRGIVSMARTSDPNSAGSQFFIVVKDSPFLDKQYTVFGHVIEGMDVADKIVNLPRDPGDDPLPANPAIIKSVKIEQRTVPNG